jgi:hypothetical protein
LATVISQEGAMARFGSLAGETPQRQLQSFHHDIHQIHHAKSIAITKSIVIKGAALKIK